MALTIKYTPGKVVTQSDLLTFALLNLIANPTIELEGSIGAASIADNAVTLSKLIDGILTADAPGRAKMADGYVNTVKLLDGLLSADAAGRLKMADGFLTYAKLAQDAKTTGATASGLATARNLILRNDAATPTQRISGTFSELVVKDGNKVPVLLGPVSNLQADITSSGVNGLDTGAEAGSTWYYIWVIWNGTTTSTLFSLSSSAPTLPGGYTYKALVGAVRNGAPGGTATDFMPFWQAGNRVWINNAVIFTGKAGATTYAVLAGADLTAFQAAVPPIARAALGMAGTTSAAAHAMAVAASADAGTVDAAELGACFISMGGVQLATNENGNMYRVPLRWETPPGLGANLQWKADGVTAIYRLSVSGFEL